MRSSYRVRKDELKPGEIQRGIQMVIKKEVWTVFRAICMEKEVTAQEMAAELIRNYVDTEIRKSSRHEDLIHAQK